MDTSFGLRLKNLRKAHNLSQADLARVVGVSRSAISSYENSSRCPDHETLRRLASCFQVSLDYLLGTDDMYAAKTENYLKILVEINELLVSSPIDQHKKQVIMEDVRDYFTWRIDQAKNRPSGEEE